MSKELDREINELVFGRSYKDPGHGPCCTCQDCGYYYDDCICGYSESIEKAWLVVEKLGEMGYSINVEWKGADRAYAFTAQAVVYKGIYAMGIGVGTVPEAICYAAVNVLKNIKEGDISDGI